VRVLKPSGSLFVNLGDRYASRPGAGPNRTAALHQNRNVAPLYGEGTPKSLLGMPWRYALGCVDDLGLILRAEIVWAKPNGLPESVTDRVRRAHEQVFHFTKQPRYYSAVDEVREAYEPDSAERKRRYGNNPGRDGLAALRATGAAQHGSSGISAMGVGGAHLNPLGKLPSSVWSIPSAPLTVPAHLGVDHFAAYPPELVRRIILGWSPAAVCTGCGEGRRPMVDRKPMPISAKVLPHRSSTMLDGSRGDAGRNNSGQEFNRWRAANPEAITGYACACPGATAPATPGIVLDPFAGTGTTMLVASVFGRIGIGVDRSADYCRLAQWRCSDPGERARALDVPKPPPVADGQEALF
jgi:hypothetical protein